MVRTLACRALALRGADWASARAALLPGSLPLASANSASSLPPPSRRADFRIRPPGSRERARRLRHPHAVGAAAWSHRQGAGGGGGVPAATTITAAGSVRTLRQLRTLRAPLRADPPRRLHRRESGGEAPLRPPLALALRDPARSTPPTAPSAPHPPVGYGKGFRDGDALEAEL
eukprot:gene10043-10679_t